jgi:glycolate oxidase FAD binding subunit
VDSALTTFARDHGAAGLSEEQAREWWDGLRHQGLRFFRGAAGSFAGADPDHAPLWRLSVPSTAAAIDLPGTQLIEWGGALRWWRTGAEASAIREAAARAGGHATLFRGGPRTGGVFTPLPPPMLALHRRLKAEFDPHGIFNPGRLVPDL